MAKRLFLIFLFLLLTGAAAPGELVVATYNIENYGPADRMTDEGYRQAYPKPEKEKSALRRVLLALQADVLVVEEMGPGPYLRELQGDLRAQGLDYSRTELLEAADAERHVALLARVPIRNLHRHTDLSFRYFAGTERVKRGMLEFTFDAPGGAVTCFAVHLKSKFTERSDDPLSEIRRAGEAGSVRDRILAEFPRPSESRLILLGDFNEGRGSRTVARLSQRGNLPLLFQLPATDVHGEVWTHNYGKEEIYSRIDHVFISAALRDEVADDTARIGWGSNVSIASDHRPVSMKLIQRQSRPVEKEK